MSLLGCLLPTANHRDPAWPIGQVVLLGLLFGLEAYMFLVSLQQGFFLSFAAGIKPNERNGALALKN